jgi:hypothetical protein
MYVHAFCVACPTAPVEIGAFFCRARMHMSTWYLIIDDLASELRDTRHIPVPIPTHVLKNERKLREFTMQTLRSLMALPMYTWHHAPEDVVIDGFTVRGHSVYPSFST